MPVRCVPHTYPVMILIAIFFGGLSPESLSADDSLQKKMAPFIGRWVGTSKAFGGFEGTVDQGELEWNLSFRWVPGKHAVEHQWHVTYADSGENFSSGTEMLYHDAESEQFRVISSGIDGNVAWSNQGTVSWIKRGVEVNLKEQTVNGTKSTYVVRRVKEGPNTLMLSVPSRVIDGEDFGEVQAFPLKRQPNPRYSNQKLAEAFFEYILSDPEMLKPLLHEDFEFTYMGKIKGTLLPYGVPYATDDFFEKWLPHIPKLLPEGIELKTLQVIAGDEGVAVVQKGDAQGKYGRYDNDYVWIFTIEDGKILSVEEYNSDLLVATRVYGQKVTPPEE